MYTERDSILVRHKSIFSIPLVYVCMQSEKYATAQALVVKQAQVMLTKLTKLIIVQQNITLVH